SGLGFGLLFWLGIGYPEVYGMSAFGMFFVAYALAVGGLLASTAHLGNPKNAIHAFSQWRTSWLSREGIASVVTLLLMAVYAIGMVFLGQRFQILGWIGAALSMFTVFTTSMIYAQLKTVPRWNMRLTSVMFLTYAVAGGALLAGQISIAVVLLLVLTLVQFAVWQAGDKRFREAGHTIETATGLGNLGKVRLLEPPHTSPNYLMKEMVFTVGRKHSRKLRMIAGVSLGLLPVILLYSLPFNPISAALAVAFHVLGLFAARWLFFAEAEHVVGLYYDKR
ncbi:MAG: DmsC/YnfH family molybdoenzyme membrane anchor subunit, partial [Mariprofundaceae bacterium]|nr:DmsC/YnfH family molybdoenzyme membrane anchor subunit [Mariprofundaceae bacterium]